MWHFLKRAAGFFATGFIATFIITLFIMFDAGDVIMATGIALAGGVALAIAVFILERRFPDEPEPPAQS